MKCSHCGSTHFRKNGKRRGKQNHFCLDCNRQFTGTFSPSQKSSNDLKSECLQMYLNGLGFRAIERIKKVSHVTVMNWVKKLGERLDDAPEPESIPEVG